MTFLPFPIPDTGHPDVFWSALWPSVTTDWRTEAAEAIREAEATRHKARYNPTLRKGRTVPEADRATVGSISEAAYLTLRALVRWFQPATVVEIGTFIGTSTRALAAATGKVWTCDKDNDCLPPIPNVESFPRWPSTRFLKHLVDRKVSADFFFFDGRVQEADVRSIVTLSTSQSVYVFDDFIGNEKGVRNVRMLAPFVPPGHWLVRPPSVVPGCASSTTIAVIGPGA